MKKSTLVCMLTGLLGLSTKGQWTEAALSNYRWQMGSTVVGSKIFYAGGDQDNALSIVDIYDSETGITSTTNMSVDRRIPNVTNCQGRVLIAGGVNDLGEVMDVVDVYNTATQAWTLGPLTQARFGISAVSNGGQALFAGGTTFPPTGGAYSTVDVYNCVLGSWAIADLSVARGLMGSVVAGNKAFFAGGYANGGVASDQVDIYDFTTFTWSTATLSSARWGLAAAVAGSKVLFAGGQNNGVASDRVDIYDLNTGTWSTASLSVARSFFGGSYATTACDKALFVGGTLIDETNGEFAEDHREIDVYDGATDTWSATQLPYPLIAHSTDAIDDQVFVSGGATIVGSVYQTYGSIRIWADGCNVGVSEVTGSDPGFTVFPDPAEGQFTIHLQGMGNANYQLMDTDGRTVRRGRLSGEQTTVGVDELDRGIYVLRVEHNGTTTSQWVVLR